MNFVPPFTRWNEPGQHHSDHAFPNGNRLTDFELWFVGTPSDRLEWCCVHPSIVAQVASWMIGTNTQATTESACITVPMRK